MSAQRRSSWLFRVPGSTSSASSSTSSASSSSSLSGMEGMLNDSGSKKSSNVISDSSTAKTVSHSSSSKSGIKAISRKFSFTKKDTSKDNHQHGNNQSANAGATDGSTLPPSSSSSSSSSHRLSLKLGLSKSSSRPPRSDNQSDSDFSFNENDPNALTPQASTSSSSSISNVFSSSNPSKRKSWIRSNRDINTKDISNMLDKALLEKSKSPSQKINKVLIGGLEYSGKSTVFKQIILHARGPLSTLESQNSNYSASSSSYSNSNRSVNGNSSNNSQQHQQDGDDDAPCFDLEEKQRALDILASAYHELARFIAEYVQTVNASRNSSLAAKNESERQNSPNNTNLKKSFMRQNSTGFDFSGALDALNPIYEKSAQPLLEMKNAEVITPIMGPLFLLLDIPLITNAKALAEPICECLKRLGMSGTLSDNDLGSVSSNQTIGHVLASVFQNLNMHKICLQAYRSGKISHLPVPYLLSQSKRILKGIVSGMEISLFLTNDDVIHAAGSLNTPALSNPNDPSSVQDHCDVMLAEGHQFVDLCRNRKKWPNHFSKVKAFIYVVNLGAGVAHITESLVVFKQLIQSPYLEKTSFIICFTRLDFLQDDLQMKKEDIEQVKATVRSAFQDCYSLLTRVSSYESSHVYGNSPQTKSGLKFHFISATRNREIAEVLTSLKSS